MPLPGFTTAVSCFLCKAQVSLICPKINIFDFRKLISLPGAVQERGQEQAGCASQEGAWSQPGRLSIKVAHYKVLWSLAGHGLPHGWLHHEQGGEDCHTGDNKLWIYRGIFIWTFQNVVGGRQPKLIQLQPEESEEEMDDDEGEVFKSTMNRLLRKKC